MDSNTKIIAVAVIALIVGLGAGYGISWALSDSDSNDYEYSFYLYFDADDERNGWYTGTASNAGDGFKNAMNKAELDYVINEHGYLASVEGEGVMYGWSTHQYLYKDTDPVAAEGSIANWEGVSNGWASVSGYSVEEDTFLISQMSSKIFFFSIYEKVGEANWVAPLPWEMTEWMDEGPFSS